MKNTLLEIKDLKKIYHNKEGETEAIGSITLDVYQNEIVAIVGPSGCGKSTLLSILTNLEEKSEGTILFNSNDKIGYMLQSDSLFPWLTILDNCLIGLEVTKNKNEETINKVNNMLDKYGLKDFKDKYPNSLSGGMKQRVLRILYTHK